MSRALSEIIAHIRAVSANPAISTTLIQTEDLEALCASAEKADRLHDALSGSVGWIEECGSDHDGRQYVLTEARAAMRDFRVVTPSKKSLLSIAVWHDEHAICFPEGHDMRRFHERQAAECRAQANGEETR